MRRIAVIVVGASGGLLRPHHIDRTAIRTATLGWEKNEFAAVGLIIVAIVNRPRPHPMSMLHRGGLCVVVFVRFAAVDPSPSRVVSDPSRLVTIDDAARILAVSRSTVYRLIDAGTLRRVKLGQSVRIRLDDIDHAVEHLTVDTNRDSLPRWW